MSQNITSRSFALLAALAVLPGPLLAQSTRLLHHPDVSAQYVAFTYAGDIWLVPRAGGDARRVTSSPTVEKDPHFSPDGKWLAFTGEYNGNDDVYVVAVAGGEPRQLTWHPGPDDDFISYIFLQQPNRLANQWNPPILNHKVTKTQI